MAELDLSYDPPWLHRSPQAAALPMSLAESFQLQQERQKQSALLPLQQQQMQGEIANAALDHQIKQQQMDLMLQAKAADAAGWEQASKVTDWLDLTQVNPIYAQGAKRGGFSAGFAGFLEKMQQGAQMTDSRAKTLQTQLDIANMKLAAPQKETTLQDTIDNAVRDENVSRKAKGKPEMNPGEKADFSSTLRNQSSVLGGGKEEITTWDAQGNPSFRMTKGMPQGTTVGLQTKAQEDMLNNKKAFDIAHDLSSSLDPSSVGAIAVAKNFVFDKALAQLDPALADNKRIDDRTKLITARNQMVRLVNSNSRFSALDRQEAEQAMPSPGIVESYPDVQQKLSTLQGIFKRRTYQDAIAQGTTPPYWSMASDKEVISMFKKKKAELEQGIKDNKITAAKANALIMHEQADAAQTLAEQYGYAMPAAAP